ncbi:GNAT family N-acetyltransferase [Arthrobacter sp. HLT1-20]
MSLTHQPAQQFQCFEGHAPPVLWAAVAALFSASFSADPYFEDPDDLATITGWGPVQLAQPGGRLVVAHSDGAIAAFALSHGLVEDAPWQQILAAAVAPESPYLAADPRNVVVVQELAVAAAHRGRGLAGECVRRLLANRTESHVVLGVYSQAAPARALYRKWGFEELGTTTDAGSPTTLRVLGHPLPWPAPNPA